VVVGSLVAATIWSLWKRPKVGFAMAMFFACLAPTSSIVPVTTQTMAEHRMYLALAAEIGLVTVGVWMAWQKLGKSITGSWRFAPLGAACFFAVVLAFMTFNRNRDYQSPLGMWLDTVAKRPTNARAYNGVGQALKDMRRYDEALVFYSQSIEVEPRTAKWHCNRGNCYYAMQEFPRAIADYDNALRLDPNLKGAYANRSASHFFLREYDMAWDDVRRAVEHGAKPHPDFLKALTRASGRAIDPALANLPIENE
jgi:tetratricopeptide (TPR) repeat protein